MRSLVSDTPPPLLDYLPSGSGTLVPITPRAGPGSPFSVRYGEDHQAAWAIHEQQVGVYSLPGVDLLLTGLLIVCGVVLHIGDDATARSDDGFNIWNTTYYRSASKLNRK